MFSDESIFRVIGYVNTQNIRIWPKGMPTELDEALLSSPDVVIWCAVLREKIIRPFSFDEGIVTGATYRNTLIQ